jgi:hypothetical protein
MSLLTDLVGYWKCDEASGNLLDAHGSNPFVTSANDPGSTTGKINGGRDLEIDTANSYFTINDNADVSLGADVAFTWQLWHKAESFNGGDGLFLTKFKTSPASGNDCEYRVRWDGANSRFAFDIGNGSSNASVGATSHGSFSTGTWYHILAWHDPVANTINIQINGGSVDSTSWSGGTQDTNGPLYINTQTNVLGSNVFSMDGVVDEIGFWKRVLTSGERTSLYNSGNGLAYADFGGGGAGLVGPLVRHGHLIGSPLVGGRLIRTAA